MGALEALHILAADQGHTPAISDYPPRVAAIVDHYDGATLAERGMQRLPNLSFERLACILEPQLADHRSRLRGLLQLCQLNHDDLALRIGPHVEVHFVNFHDFMAKEALDEPEGHELSLLVLDLAAHAHDMQGRDCYGSKTLRAATRGLSDFLAREAGRESGEVAVCCDALDFSDAIIAAPFELRTVCQFDRDLLEVRLKKWSSVLVAESA